MVSGEMQDAVKGSATRHAILNWEECVRALGRRFSVVEWTDRFGLARRGWDRWIAKGRGELGLALAFERESSSNGTYWCVVSDEDMSRLRAWVAALEAFYVDGVRSNARDRGANVEGLAASSRSRDSRRDAPRGGR